MSIQHLHRNWNSLGESDPYWAVLTDARYINNKWDVEKFYQTGQQHFNFIFSKFKQHNLLPCENIVDFGCGPGRLTFQLAKHCNKIIGVDISEAMIHLAREYNPFPTKCSFIANNDQKLMSIATGSQDLIFSFITLQHIPKQLVLGYLDEFVRILRPNGYILINVPSKPPRTYGILHTLLGTKGLNFLRKLRYKKQETIEMHWIPKEELLQYTSTKNMKSIEVIRDKGVGPDWESYFYLLKKTETNAN